MDIKEYIDEFMVKCMEVGVKEEDILYISSDVTKLTLDACRKCGLKGKKDINDFYGSLIDGMQQMMTDKGTLLFPVFTWSFCRGIPYDVRTTQGEVGALGNWVLNNRRDFRRTEHPLYSFMVWGKDMPRLCEMNNRTAWGQDSPFGYLHENNGKNLLIDISLGGSFTFLHYVEETIGVPHRYFKDFHGEYITKDGIREERTYTMFVRDLDIDSSQVTPDDCMVNAGVAKKVMFGAEELQLVDLTKAFSFVEDDLRYHNGSNWYDFKGYKLDWSAGQTHPDESEYTG